RSTYPNLPAYPFDAGLTLETLGTLQVRARQVQQAKEGLNRKITIAGVKKRAYAVLFGTGAASASEREQRAAIARSLSEHPGSARRQLERSLNKRGVAVGSTNPDVTLTNPKQFALSWTSFDGVSKAGQKHLSGYAASLRNRDEATKRFWPMISGHG